MQLVPIHEYNKCHNPEGEGGGQFCSSTSGVAKALPKIVPQARSRSSEANYSRGRIEVGEKFWTHSPEHREHIMRHELGHWFRDQFVSLDAIMGFEEGEKFFNLFGMGDSEEGFAEAFAVFIGNPQELEDRYPDRYADLRKLVTDDDVEAVRAFARTHSR